MTKHERCVLAGIGLLAAGGIAWMATRSVGPVPLTQYTEQRQGPLAEHLVTREELGYVPATSRMHYPARTAPGLTALIAQGFAPLYQLPDPVAASLPAEQAW